MPAITIEQAYAIALQTYIDPANNENNGRLACSSGLVYDITQSNTSVLHQLLNTTTKDLGVITAKGAELIPGASIFDEATYTLVASTVDSNTNLINDIFEGGSIDSTPNALSTAESKIHRTGQAIIHKLKK